MHDASYKTMANVLAGVSGESLKVLDVGSLDVNGTYKPLVVGRGWSYTGLDIRPGKNVDIVTDDPFRFPVESDRYDLVISGSTMEHVTAIWRWVPELARVLRPGGLLAIVTHWQHPEHKYPIDCWRILPDGMRFLFDETQQLHNYTIEITNETDIVGTAWKYES